MRAPPDFVALTRSTSFVNGHNVAVPIGRALFFISPLDIPGWPGVQVGVHLNAGKKLRFLSTTFEIHSGKAADPIRVVGRLRRVPRGSDIDALQESFAKTGALKTPARQKATFLLELVGFQLPDSFILRSPAVDLLGIPYPIIDVYYRYFPERGGHGVCRPSNNRWRGP